MHYKLCLILSVILVAVPSCKKFIEVEPPVTALSAGNIYTTDATAAAVLTDIYADLSEQNQSLSGQNIPSISLYSSLGADELTLYNLNAQNMLAYYQNNLNLNTQPNYWNPYFQALFAANNAIAGLSETNALTPAVKQQLLGEAKFMRAFFYFYLVNMFGDVPLVLNLDYKHNALLARSKTSDVYSQIISDLTSAEELLSAAYLNGDALTAYTAGTEERVRPTKWAASALLARAYLYIKDYKNAEAEATKVINNTALYQLVALQDAFLKNNKESIWQLQPVGNNNNANTGEGKIYILPLAGPSPDNNPVYLSKYFIQAFEPGDLRRSNWTDSVIVNGITYNYPYKYKIGNVITNTQEYPVVLRLAEQYLIRAEARAAQNNVAGAQSDLNFIRTRAGLANTIAADKDALLMAVLQERKAELFTEWGHRWFDLKRTGQINSIMTQITPTKGGNWLAQQALFPVPQDEINKDPNLTQNPGYN